MNREQAVAKIHSVVATIVHVPQEKVTDDSRFVEDLGMDSLHMTEVGIGLEEEFDLEIPVEHLMEYSKVGELYGYVERRTSERAKVKS